MSNPVDINKLENIIANQKKGKLRSQHKGGRSFHDLSALEMVAMYQDRHTNKMKWNDIEIKWGLTRNNGMTAYNAVKKVKKALAEYKRQAEAEAEQKASEQKAA